MQSQNEFTINKKYTRLTIQKFAYALLIIGAINWLFIGFFDLNLLTGIFGLNLFSRALFVLVGLAGIYFMFQRDFYLPFLGESVLPCSGLEDREPSGADTSVTVQVEPFAKVLYWAAEPDAESLKEINDWRKAYSAFKNIGVTTADESGSALLNVRKPQPYTVPFKGRIEPHIHYRVCEEDGMIGSIRTVFLAEGAGGVGAVEGFTSGTGAEKQSREFNMNAQLDAEKLLSNLSKALPQVQQAMTALNNQFAMDAQSGVESSEQHSEIAGQTIAEAFRSY